jgi:hypothetical protein
MVNPIEQILITNETRLGASLQVMQLFQDFVYRISEFQQLCILNHLKLLRGNRIEAGKNWLYQWLRYLYYLILYYKISACGADSEKKTSSPTRKMDIPFKSLAETRRYYWEYQRCTEPNQQNTSEDINVWWKLHRSILGEYRYTSLELAVRLGAVRAYPIADFRTSNPLRAGSRKNNKQKCHR